MIDLFGKREAGAADVAKVAALAAFLSSAPMMLDTNPSEGKGSLIPTVAGAEAQTQRERGKMSPEQKEALETIGVDIYYDIRVVRYPKAKAEMEKSQATSDKELVEIAPEIKLMRNQKIYGRPTKSVITYRADAIPATAQKDNEAKVRQYLKAKNIDRVEVRLFVDNHPAVPQVVLWYLFDFKDKAGRSIFPPIDVPEKPKDR